jgi:thioredoxin reductase
MTHSRFDIAVVGGSYAGIAAALQAARARRAVLVIDAGIRRNRFAEASHGFLAQDGRSPAAIAADARAQLLAYPNVTWHEATATRVHRTDRGFSIETAERDVYEARRLVLAIGVVDELPDIPGLGERWGKSVFHCPYCHGYELNNGRLGVLATGPLSVHQAMMIPDWGKTVLFTNGALDLDAEQAARLELRGVSVEREAVTGITGVRADVQLRDGRVVLLDGLFTASTTKVASPLAEQLGCAFDDGPLGRFIRTDTMKETTVPGVFACGDAARAMGSISFAVGDGAAAGGAAHQSLIFR